MRFLIPTLLLPAAALAGTGFDGTWKTNIESLKTTGKPLALLLAGGEYTCSACNPPYTVKADGADHKVTGRAYFDTVQVTVTGPSSAEIVLKQGSKEVVRFSDTVSADGTTLTSKVTNHVGAQIETDELTAKRVAAITPFTSPAGSKLPLTSYGRKSKVPVYLLPSGVSTTVSIRLNDPVGLSPLISQVNP